MSATVHCMGSSMVAQFTLLPPEVNPKVNFLIAKSAESADGRKGEEMAVYLGLDSTGPAVFILTKQPHPMGGERPSVYMLPLGEMLEQMVMEITLGIRASADDQDAPGESGEVVEDGAAGCDCQMPPTHCSEDCPIHGWDHNNVAAEPGNISVPVAEAKADLDGEES